MGTTKDLERGNFGLSQNNKYKIPQSNNSDYDNWFWESKTQKKLRSDQKSAAMQHMLTEQDNSQSSGISVGKIALIGGLVVVLGIGAVVLIKKNGKTPLTEKPLSTNDLTV